MLHESRWQTTSLRKQPSILVFDDLLSRFLEYNACQKKVVLQYDIDTHGSAALSRDTYLAQIEKLQDVKAVCVRVSSSRFPDDPHRINQDFLEYTEKNIVEWMQQYLGPSSIQRYKKGEEASEDTYEVAFRPDDYQDKFRGKHFQRHN